MRKSSLNIFTIFPAVFISGIFIFAFLITPAQADVINIPNPTDNLNVKIPGMARLTDAKACTDDKNMLCVSWLGEYITSVYKYAIGIVGILATVVMMYGGLKWLLAAGDPSAVNDAKSWITGSITGLVIAMTSYLILYQINPNLVSFKPIRVGMVPKMDIQTTEITYTGGGGELGTTNIPTSPSTRDQWDPQLQAAAAKYGVECTLLKAFMFAESAGNPNAVSQAGAVGLIQLMPSTASAYGYTNLTDPAQNTMAAAAYIHDLQGRACNGAASNEVCSVSDIKYVIAAYNGGPKANSVSKTCPGTTYWECDANSGYAETRKYVPNVTSNYNKLKTAGGC